MMNRSRLRKIEERLRVSSPCPQCSHDPATPEKHSVNWEPNPPTKEPLTCQECGHTWRVVTWDDIEVRA